MRGRCKICGRAFKKSKFNPHASYCGRRCRRRADYVAHMEERRARARAFHVAHKEERNARSRAYHAAHREEVSAKRRAAHPAAKCKVCGQSFLTQTSRSVLCSAECRRIHYYAETRRWRAENTAKLSTYARAYNAEHREERNAKSRARKAARKEEVRAYSYAYHATHREERCAKARTYRAAHREEAIVRLHAYRATPKAKADARIRKNPEYQIARLLRQAAQLEDMATSAAGGRK